MSGAAFLLIAVVLSLVGSIVIWLRARQPVRWDSGIDEFNRNMQALAPENRSDSDDEPHRDSRAGSRE